MGSEGGRDSLLVGPVPPGCAPGRESGELGSHVGGTDAGAVPLVPSEDEEQAAVGVEEEVGATQGTPGGLSRGAANLASARWGASGLSIQARKAKSPSLAACVRVRRSCRLRMLLAARSAFTHGLAPTLVHPAVVFEDSHVVDHTVDARDEAELVLEL
jgi:hypothetical protein